MSPYLEAVPFLVQGMEGSLVAVLMLCNGVTVTSNIMVLLIIPKFIHSIFR